MLSFGGYDTLRDTVLVGPLKGNFLASFGLGWLVTTVGIPRTCVVNGSEFLCYLPGRCARVVPSRHHSASHDDDLRREGKRSPGDFLIKFCVSLPTLRFILPDALQELPRRRQANRPERRSQSVIRYVLRRCFCFQIVSVSDGNGN